MKRAYPISNLTELTDEQLDLLLIENGQVFSEKNQRAIQKRIQKKRRLKHHSTKIILGIAATLLLIPTSVYSVSKVWSILTQQDNFLTTLTVQKDTNNQQAYKLNFTYVPENLQPHSDGMKYWHPETQSGGFSSLLLRPKNIEEYKVPFSTDVQEMTINERPTFFVKRSIVQNSFDTVAFMICEKENLIVELYFDSSLTKQEQEKILAGITLEQTTKEQSTIINEVVQESGDTPHITGLRKDSQNIYQLDEPIRINDSDLKLEMNISDYSEGLMLPDFQAKPSSYHLSQDDQLILTPEGTLLPYTAKIYRPGDGIAFLDEQINTIEVQPLYKEVTFTIQNLSKQPLEEFYFSPTFEQLQIKKSRYQPKEETTYTEPFLIRNEPIYVEGVEDGKAFYNIGTFMPGEKKIIRIGYLDAYPEEDEEFIKINLSGTYVENFNSPEIQWIQLPKNK